MFYAPCCSDPCYQLSELKRNRGQPAVVVVLLSWYCQVLFLHSCFMCLSVCFLGCCLGVFRLVSCCPLGVSFLGLLCPFLIFASVVPALRGCGCFLSFVLFVCFLGCVFAFCFSSCRLHYRSYRRLGHIRPHIICNSSVASTLRAWRP